MIKDALKSIISIVPPQFRRHPLTGKHYRRIKKSLTISHEELEKLRLIELRRMVYLAYNNTKGYRQLYKEHGIQPSDIQALDDVKHLPTVNKALLRDNIKEFSVLGPQHRYNTTGGTTGEPFGFFLSRGVFAAEAAFIQAYWEAYGWSLGDKSLVMRGSYVGTDESFYKYSNYTKELYFSTYHLNEKNFDTLLAQTKKHKIKYLQSYPSALSILCDLIKETGKNEFNFDAILLGSENIYPWQIEKFKATFPDTSIHAWYGQAEKCAYATLIPNSNFQYEVQPLYGLVEQGQTNENGMSEIIATGFINTSTPFIRYETNDYAKFTQTRHKNCLYQNSTIFEKIDGRLQEVVITKSGNYLSMTSFSIHEGLFNNIKQFQIHQKKQGEITLKYIPTSSFSDPELENIKGSLSKKFGTDLDVHFEQVNDIERTHRGKLRYLVQELDVQYSLDSSSNS